MECLRTPDERFEQLPDFDFAPHYVDVGGLRMHYLDEGPRDGPVVLLLHGEPTWCYLYRKMLPLFAAAGCRVLAPDLIGFGRSDKPVAVSDYSYQRHLDWLSDWLHQVDPRQVTLFGQDWGSLLGLRLVAAEPSRFARVFIGNGGLPTGDRKMPAAFALWRAFALHSPVFPVGRIVWAAATSRPGPAVRAAYNAPFPDKRYQAGARAFPALVPSRPDDPASEPNRAAWAELSRFDKPFHTTFSDGDPITRGMDKSLRRKVPGASDVAHTTIRGAGHFLQEDQGEAVARFMLEQMGLAG
jgi:haloalkane dehalogenase